MGLAPPAPTCAHAEGCPGDAEDAARLLIEAHSWADWATRQQTEHTAIEPWSRCAAIALPGAMGAADRAVATEAATLATDCTDAFFGLAPQGASRRWSEGPTRIGGLEVTLEFRKLSPYLEGPLSLMRARDVPATAFGGQRFVSRGFGVPLAVMTPRCDDGALCKLLPREGVFRSATAWFESTTWWRRIKAAAGDRRSARIGSACGREPALSARARHLGFPCQGSGDFRPASPEHMGSARR